MAKPTKKAATTVQVARGIFEPFDLHRLIFDKARTQFEAEGIDLTKVQKIETELASVTGLWEHIPHWQIHVRIEFEE